jgi:hypothetical protein
MRFACLLVCCLAIAGCGPIGPFPGGPLRGEVVPGPVTDWSFSDEHPLIQVETRPAFPHSITTICFTHQGKLYVPARGGAEKKWPYYLLVDPAVKVRIDGRVYLGRATRISDDSQRNALFEAAARKYERLADRSADEMANVWVFRIDSSS